MRQQRQRDEDLTRKNHELESEIQRLQAQVIFLFFFLRFPSVHQWFCVFSECHLANNTSPFAI